MPEQPTPHHPDDPAQIPATVHDTDLHDKSSWQGPTYYGRSQLKAAPFNNWVVGGYVAIAGLSGAAALIAAIADVTEGNAAAPTVRRGRYLSLAAPTIGSLLLIWDLHTPKRFYNMFRIAKRTSPMSIGTWILTAFSTFAMGTAALQALGDHRPGWTWARRLARVTQVPAAISGAGLGTYTAALLSATSTPLWAAAPRWMAARFGSSSIVAGASALSLLEGSGRRRRSLDALVLAALSTELAATIGSHRTYVRRGVEGALEGHWGQVEKIAATGLGAVMPAVLQSLSLAVGRGRPGTMSDAACLAAIAGSLLLRVSMMEAGNVSASRPDISFRFSQPENLPPQR
jgi:protein NrfD